MQSRILSRQIDQQQRIPLQACRLNAQFNWEKAGISKNPCIAFIFLEMWWWRSQSLLQFRWLIWYFWKKSLTKICLLTWKFFLIITIEWSIRKINTNIWNNSTASGFKYITWTHVHWMKLKDGGRESVDATIAHFNDSFMSGCWRFHFSFYLVPNWKSAMRAIVVAY